MKKHLVIPHTPWAASSLWTIEPKSLCVLIVSMAILGFGDGLLVLANFGSSPWTVLSQGIALQGGFSIGWGSFWISCLVMLMWWPLKLKAGIGTILNVIVIAFFLGLTTKMMPEPAALSHRFAFGIVGLLLYGLGTALYLTCHQGAGPRDGLMVGFCQHFHLKVGIVRTTIEILVCILGFLLGGTVGLGTLVFAAGIGWIVQFCLWVIAHLPHFLHKGDNLA